jgi:murein DD-endopeptidase MepM/ murein hydrolase activator NlpD
VESVGPRLAFSGAEAARVSMDGAFDHAEELLLAGRHRECIEFCRKSLELCPRSVTLRLFLAQALLRTRRVLPARQEVERCLEIDPGSRLARKLLGTIAQTTDRAVDETGPTTVRPLQALSSSAYKKAPRFESPPTPPRPPRSAPSTAPKPFTFPGRDPSCAAGQIVSRERAPSPPTVSSTSTAASLPSGLTPALGPAWIPSRRRTPSRIGRALQAARLDRSVRAVLWILVGLAAAVPLSRRAGRSSRPTVVQGSMVPLAAEPRSLAPTPDPNTLALLGDLWIHPLAGPIRRMPIRDSRLFGAEREGDRPGECRGGHCGVDIGGERYGEPVLAVHDGVVEYVERGPNPLRGGRFVRIAHRDGTVYTQYFHLASIPSRLAPGVAVSAGDVIGFVGTSGVHRSGPHLHFTIAVKSRSEERYLDPEPLIALWPLRASADAGGPSTILASVAPGLARGHLRHSRRRHHHHHDTD